MNGPVALITGCSTGIGRAAARRLSEAGYRVVATARRVEALGELNAELKLPLDVERTDSVAAAVAETLRTLGRIDVLINNAGYGQIGALEEVSEEQLHKVFEVNVHGVMRMIRAVLPYMRRQGSGRIINLSSVAGRVSFPTMGAYCATKFALEALSDALRAEVAPFGIQVVLIEPGAIRTEFEKTALQSVPQSAAGYDRLYRTISAGFARANQDAPGPEAVAEAIQNAIELKRPKARYQVPISARFAARLLPLISDRLKDWAYSRIMK